MISILHFDKEHLDIPQINSTPSNLPDSLFILLSRESMVCLTKGELSLNKWNSPMQRSQLVVNFVNVFSTRTCSLVLEK